MADALETDWYSDDIATFGDRVVAARDALGLSDDELARRLGIKLKTLQAWEQDVSEPRANKLQMLAGILNVSFRWLLTGEGEGVAGPIDADNRDLNGLLIEMRQLRSEMVQNAERLGRLEKRLQAVMRGLQ